MICVIATARSKRSGSSAKPGANPCMIHGIAICRMVTNSSNATTKTDSTSSANRRAASRPPSDMCRANSGTNAALNAPSANKRRKKFGSLNATKNASATGPAPSIAAIRISRAKPRNRLIIVKPPTVAMERSKAIQAIIRLSVATDAATEQATTLYSLEAGSWQALFGGWHPVRRVGGGPVQALSRRIIRIIGTHFLRHNSEKISMNLF